MTTTGSRRLELGALLVCVGWLTACPEVPTAPTGAAPDTRQTAEVHPVAITRDEPPLTPPPPGTPPTGQAALIERGAALIETYQCNRCHDGLPSGPAPRDKHCVHCHQQIHDGTYELGDGPTQARWREHIVHLRDVPTLDGLGQRLDRAWLAAWLQEPVDLRPRLEATMPRLALDPAEAEAIAAFLTRDAPPAGPDPSGGEPEAGLRTLVLRGCTTCHTFSGAALPPLVSTAPIAIDPAKIRSALALAPDLRHTRSRFRADRLDAWLSDPAAVHPGTLMPSIRLEPTERRDVIAALLHTPLTTPAPPPLPERLPILTRKVGWDEVERRVFKTVCWHCHADAELADGDGGPGNTGGFGFPGRGVSVASWSDLHAGRRTPDGKRHSLFELRPDGTPFLVAVLMARHAEVAGQPVEGLRGMPLGLPPMSLEQIQLVESWIAQGRPR